VGKEFHESGSVDSLLRTRNVQQVRLHATLQGLRHLGRGDAQALSKIFGLWPRPILYSEFEKKRDVLALHGPIVSPISNLEIGNRRPELAERDRPELAVDYS
jgi:hypothetical protein